MSVQDNTTPKRTRSEQARINGANSRGPTSPEGKARSSRNSLKHGFAAVINNVLRIEDQGAFNIHLDGLRSSWRPQDYFENMLVDQLASISWRQSRLVGLETALIDAQMSIQDENLEALHPFSGENAYFKLVLTWQALARQPQKPLAPEPGEPMDPTIPPDGYDISSIGLVRRYLTSLDRQFRNTLLNLRQYRKDLAASSADVPAQTSADPDEPHSEPEKTPKRAPNHPSPASQQQKPAPSAAFRTVKQEPDGLDQGPDASEVAA